MFATTRLKFGLFRRPSSILACGAGARAKQRRCFSADKAKGPEVKLMADNLEKLFLHPNVQNSLKRLSKFEVDVVFQPKPVYKRVAPKYLFLTDEELRLVSY